MYLSDQFGSSVRNLLLMAFLLASTCLLSAQVVTVGCSGGPGFDYTTLSAALAASNVSDIIVSGSCTEDTRVYITGRQLNITGTAGATIASSSGNGSLGTKSPLLRLRNLILDNYMVFAPEGNVEFDTCIIRNSGNGVEIWKQAQVSMTSTIVEDNDIGISVRLGGHLLLNGLNTIRNNRIGISDDGGTVWIAWANDFTSNQTGLRLFDGARANVAGAVTFTDNQFGIALTNGSVQTSQQDGHPLFRNNGTSGDPATAAIVAEDNSHVDLFDSQIINNRSHGVLIRDNSTIRTTNDTISGNAGNGIRLLSLSSGHIYTGMTIMGNGGGDLVCSLNSFAGGYKAGIGKMGCLTFTPTTEVQLW